MREVLDTLATGAPEMPTSRGIVWVIGVGQQTQNLSVYKARLQEWLQDTPFWEDMARDVSVWGQETYPNMRYWGNADTSRNARTRNLSFFLEHPLLLAGNGSAGDPDSARLPRADLRPTRERCLAVCERLRQHRVLRPRDEAVHLGAGVRGEAPSQSRPHAAPDARFAMAWAPNTSAEPTSARRPACSASAPPAFSIAPASAIREAYEYGGESQAGACGPQGDHQVCDADIAGAEFNLLWTTFLDW